MYQDKNFGLVYLSTDQESNLQTYIKLHSSG